MKGMMKNLKFLTVVCTLCLLCAVCVFGFAACEDNNSEHTHSYGAFAVVKAPTCTEKGVRAAVCSTCGNVETEEIAELGHDYGEWVVTQEPTCIAKGVETRVCSRDETHTETRTVAELEHDYQADVTAPTCTERGYTTYTCTRCEDSYVGDYTDKIPHDYEWTTTKEPTDTEDGIKTGVCKVCGDTITKIIPSLSHVHDYTETVIEPDCINGGYTLHVCACGDEYMDNETAALGHDYQTETTAPTCTEQGYTTYTCIRCEDSYVGDYTDALGHTPSDAVEENRVEPTDTENGSYDSVVYCSVCGEELSRETITIDSAVFTVTIKNTTKADFTAWADSSTGDKVVYVKYGEKLIIPEMVYDGMSKTAKDNDDYIFSGWYYRDKNNQERQLDLNTVFTLEGLNVDSNDLTVYAKVRKQWAGPY